MVDNNDLLNKKLIIVDQYGKIYPSYTDLCQGLGEDSVREYWEKWEENCVNHKVFFHLYQIKAFERVLDIRNKNSNDLLKQINDLNISLLEARKKIDYELADNTVKHDIVVKIKEISDQYNELILKQFTDVKDETVLITTIIKDELYNYTIEHEIEEKLFLKLYEFCMFKNYELELKTYSASVYEESKIKIKTDYTVAH